MDRPGVHQAQEGSGEQRKMEETGCEAIWDAQTTPSGYGIGESEGEGWPDLEVAGCGIPQVAAFVAGYLPSVSLPAQSGSCCGSSFDPIQLGSPHCCRPGDSTIMLISHQPVWLALMHHLTTLRHRHAYTSGAKAHIIISNTNMSTIQFLFQHCLGIDK